MNTFLIWLESTSLSRWVVESPSLLAFPGIISLHAIGMGFSVGINAMLDLRLLGVAPRIPAEELRRLFPVFWAAFCLNAVSGVLLLVGYPTKALTNPVFYLKLGLIAAAMVLFLRIRRMRWSAAAGAGDDANARLLRRLAFASLGCWIAAITAGRLLAYTYLHLRAS